MRALWWCVDHFAKFATERLLGSSWAQNTFDRAFNGLSIGIQINWICSEMSRRNQIKGPTGAILLHFRYICCFISSMRTQIPCKRTVNELCSDVNERCTQMSKLFVRRFWQQLGVSSNNKEISPRSSFHSKIFSYALKSRARLEWRDVECKVAREAV